MAVQARGGPKLCCLSHQMLVLMFLLWINHHTRGGRRYSVLTYVPNPDHNVTAVVLVFSVLTPRAPKQVTGK